jgi:predicted AlkP superfamily phosphohydrolase/phosphomutase
MDRKAMIIGLDSAVPELIKKFVDEGLLPNIKRLMMEGVFGEGYCTHPCLTGTNWTSIVSGTWPGTQGTSCMWTHFKGEPLNRIHSSFLSTSSTCEMLWEVGEKIGKKSILMKYPCTVPPTISGSIQIEGSGAPWYGLDPFEISPSICFSNNPYPSARIVKLKPATSWKNVPESFSKPLEGIIELKSKSARNRHLYNILFIDSKGSGYNKILVSPSKEVTAAELSVGEWSYWFKDNFDAKIPLYPKYSEESSIVFEDSDLKNYIGTFRFKLIELKPDASDFRLYQSQIFPTSGFTWPDSIGEELVEQVGPFQEHIGPTPVFSNWIDDITFLEELEYQAWWLGEATNYIMSHYHWDLLFLQWHGPNHAQHTFWGGIDPISPWYNNKHAGTYWGYFRRFYSAADRMIGDIIKNDSEDTLVIVTADHGHIPYVYGAAMIGNALIKAGLLSYKEDEERKKIVDWTKTKVYPINTVHIYVNLKGRDPDGIVNPGKEYEKVCKKVITTLYSIRDPNGNCPVSFAMHKNEAKMLGLYGDRVGDVIYGIAAGYIQRLTPTEDLEEWKFPKGDVPISLPTDDAGFGQRAGPLPPNTSIHGHNIPSSRLGLGSMLVPLIISGPGIKKNYLMKKQFRLIDIAPTVSHILKMPCPAQCEGSIILDVLD